MEVQRINAKKSNSQTNGQRENTNHQHSPAQALNSASYENKSLHTNQVSNNHNQIDNLMVAFNAFREANDERISQLEKNHSVDSITEAKVNRINNELSNCVSKLDEMALRQQRPAIGMPVDQHELQKKSAFEQYVRNGDATFYSDLEKKELTADPSGTSGFTVPLDLEGKIGRRLVSISPVRALATVRETTSGTYKKPYATSGFSAGWASESTTREQTDTPTIEELSFSAMELYAMPAASSVLLEDSAIDLEEWLAEEVQYSFAEQEGKAFISGDGNSKPRGILDYPQIANTSQAWGQIGTIPSGANGAFADSNAHDSLIELTHSLRAGYRANGTFIMNRNTLAEVRKLKGSDGNYLWNPAHSINQPSTLMGFAVMESEDMPDMASGSTSIAFGDFSRGYLIVDRKGVNILRDPYSAKPWILFYVTKRVGGGVMDFDAIKLLKFSAS